MRAVLYKQEEAFKLKGLVLEKTEGENILGRLVQIPYLCEGKEGWLICRVNNVSISNYIYDDEYLIKFVEKAKQEEATYLQEILEEKTITVLDIEVITALSREGERLSNKCLPTIGYPIEPIEEEWLQNILQRHTELSYIGTYMGTNIAAPLYIQDYKNLDEAYHSIVIGQSGSGKSTLVKMLLTLYAQKSQDMNFIIFDTMGEFRKSFQTDYKDSFWENSLDYIWFMLNRKKTEIYTLGENLTVSGLEGWATLCKEFDILKPLNIGKSANKEQAMDFLIKMIRNLINNQKLKFSTITQNAKVVIDIIYDNKEEFARQTYKTSESKNDLLERLEDQSCKEEIKERLEEVNQWFGSEKKSIQNLIFGLTPSSGRTIILDLSNINLRTSINRINIIKRILYELVSYLIEKGSQSYKNDQNMNTMVILEEAHNWMPARSDDEIDDQLSSILAKAYRETRKYGIGWLAITQKPTAIKRDAIDQSRLKFIGGGVLTGGDIDLLEQFFGTDFTKIYRTFEDPNDPLRPTKKVSFAVSGPINVLSQGKLEYIQLYSSSSEFLKKNNV